MARHLLSVGTNIVVSEGDPVSAGDILAKIPRETTKTKDITGGLPRVAELFEARKPKEFAVISEIDGVVSYGKDSKGKRKVIITPDAEDEKEYLIPKGKHVSVQEGDRVTAGEPLMDGVNNPHDLLMIKGEKELARYLVDEVQEVYRLQGVKINDKHMEVIVRQMLRRVMIKDPGDTSFIADEQVERFRFQEENDRVVAKGGRPAKGEPILMGITKASLSTQSFISAASFQETTRVLDRGFTGRKDGLPERSQGECHHGETDSCGHGAADVQEAGDQCTRTRDVALPEDEQPELSRTEKMSEKILDIETTN